MAELSKKTPIDELKCVLEEVVACAPVVGFEHNNRKAVSVLFKFLEPGEFPISNFSKDNVILLLILGSLHRLLHAKIAFDDIPNWKNSISCVFELLKNEDYDVTLAAVFVIRSMVVQFGDGKNSKSEIANRKSVFIDANISSLVEGKINPIYIVYVYWILF